jgi:hypothetical protein
MAETSSVRRASVFRTAGLALGLLLTRTGLVPQAEANSIRVTPVAALDGSLFGLELRLDDPASKTPTDAYVAIGPEKGVRDESALEVGFTLDPSGLVAASHRRSGRLSFLRLAGGPGRAGLVVFLEQTPLNAWFVGAWSWDDATGGFVLAGRAPFRFEDTRGVGLSALRPHLEVEWAAASEPAGRAQGYLRILSVASDGDRALLLENTELNNASQRVGYVELGVRAADHAPGVSGALFIDNFQVNRASPPLP